MTKLGRKRTYTACQSHEAHRKAQAKYVKKDPAAQRARVKRSETKHASAVKARKTKARASSSKTGKTTGRPRSC